MTMAKKWEFTRNRQKNIIKARVTAKRIWELGKKEYAKTHK